jgi:cytochrome c-type biogenesis protein CcmH
MFWPIAIAMTAVAIGLVLVPLLRRAAGAVPRAGYDLAVYRDQLTELDRDMARGLLSAEQARAARIEIERRILDAAAADKSVAATATTGASRYVAGAAAIAMPLAALALYASIGQHDLPAYPFAARSGMLAVSGGAGETTLADDAELAAMTQQLADRMALTPDDPKGWRMLGRAYATLGQFGKSAEAYGKAIELGVNDAVVYSARGEALAMMSDGIVTDAARQSFQAALRIDPGDSRARYYIALAEAQAGRLQSALDQWLALESTGSPDAPWRKTVAARIDQTARDLGLDPATLPGRKPPEASPGPTAEDMAAAATMTPEERDAYIRGMVEGLARRLKDQPDDLAGWRKLGRAYAVLGDFAAAGDAWRRAAELAPDDIEVQLSYAEVLLGGAGDENKLPEAFVTTVERIRRLDAGNSLGLFYAGLVERAAGRTDMARLLWQQLLDRLPADSPVRGDLQRRLDELGAGG